MVNAKAILSVLPKSGVSSGFIYIIEGTYDLFLSSDTSHSIFQGLVGLAQRSN